MKPNMPLKKTSTKESAPKTDPEPAPTEQEYVEVPREHHHYYHPHPEITYQHSIVHDSIYTTIHVAGINDTSTVENFLQILAVHSGKTIEELKKGIHRPKEKKKSEQPYVG